MQRHEERVKLWNEQAHLFKKTSNKSHICESVLDWLHNVTIEKNKKSYIWWGFNMTWHMRIYPLCDGTSKTSFYHLSKFWLLHIAIWHGLPKVFGICQKVKVFAKLLFDLFSQCLRIVLTTDWQWHGIVMWKIALQSIVKAKHHRNRTLVVQWWYL